MTDAGQQQQTERPIDHVDALDRAVGATRRLLNNGPSISPADRPAGAPPAIRPAENGPAGAPPQESRREDVPLRRPPTVP